MYKIRRIIKEKTNVKKQKRREAKEKRTLLRMCEFALTGFKYSEYDWNKNKTEFKKIKKWN